MDNFQTPNNMAGVPMPPAPKQGNGSWAAIIIVILIIALGGIYFWYSRNTTLNSTNSNSPSASKNSAPTANDAALNDELNAAGNVDLNADMTNLDKEFGK